MSNNDNNIEKRSFEAFVNAIGSEIEQAQVRLISAANAQMLFHYWKMGNYILYHQNRQGWGGKVNQVMDQIGDVVSDAVSQLRGDRKHKRPKK